MTRFRNISIRKKILVSMLAFIAGSKVPAEWAKQIRNGGVLRLDVSVEPI